MRFGKTLQQSIYPKWRESYIDYDKLKHLLREQDEETKWTEEDESTYVEELVNTQLEKVNSFHAKTGQELKERTASCESKLEPLVQALEGPNPSKSNGNEKETSGSAENEENAKILREVSAELDAITQEVNELEKFSRINFTGFLKAAKKHDRLRPPYKVRPLLQVRLSSLPFNSEDYSPLLYRLSSMYSFIRQKEGKDQPDIATNGVNPSPARQYESHKFWVHSDNLLEVKTYILRRLPVLIYNPQTSKVADANRPDPTITSLYFDNSKFSLYTEKLGRQQDAASLRLRWYGQLADRPDIVLERKIVPSSDEVESTGTEERLPIKEKYIQTFLEGEVPKTVLKMRERHTKSEEEIKSVEDRVKTLQAFIKDNNLEPMMRAVCTRTAFQIPGDDRIRVSLDTDVAMIREDSLDADRPCRDPDDWHRHDIDNQKMSFPFKAIRKGEVTRLPYALLEIKILSSISSRSKEWISDLMTSHLVYEAPRFSKFLHGVSVLFEDNVNSFPFWLSDLDKDIRKDPRAAWEDEQKRLKKRSEDDFAIGSFNAASPGKMPGSHSSRNKDDAGKKSGKKQRTLSESSVRGVLATSSQPRRIYEEIREEVDSDDDESEDDFEQDLPSKKKGMGNFRSMIPGFRRGTYKRRQSVLLPPGVKKPSSYIKNAGPVQVEAKVWLANQRTFIKWQHICVLLATLSLALYNAAGKHNTLAQVIGIVFTGISVFAGIWGWWMYMQRSKWITERSGKDFDNSIGPVVVCVTMIVALVLNFAFKFRSSLQEAGASNTLNMSNMPFDRTTADMLVQGGH